METLLKKGTDLWGFEPQYPAPKAVDNNGLSTGEKSNNFSLDKNVNKKQLDKHIKLLKISGLSEKWLYEIRRFIIDYLDSVEWTTDKNKKSCDYLIIRISVLSSKFVLLFNGFLYYLSFRIIKFVGTVMTSIFWYLSLSNRNMNAITFWTDFIKIPSYLKKYIIGWFNKSTFLSSQSLISDMTMVATPYKVTSMGGYQ
jgi:hypothetical protein